MTTTDINNNRLITGTLQASFKEYGLYSQDGKRKDAMCIAVSYKGKIRWYMLEGQSEGNDYTFYGIVVGLQETEYGYVSANEMADITIDGSKYGLGTTLHLKVWNGTRYGTLTMIVCIQHH